MDQPGRNKTKIHSEGGIGEKASKARLWLTNEGDGGASEITTLEMKYARIEIKHEEGKDGSFSLPQVASSVEVGPEEVHNALKENAAHTTALSMKVSEDLDKIRAEWDRNGFNFTAQ